MRRRGLQFNRWHIKINMNTLLEVISWIFGLIVVIFVALVLVFFFGIQTKVIGLSMEPNLKNGQTIFVNRFIYMVTKPKKDDVVVFLPNGNRNSHHYVKRVVGIPGDTVQISSGKLYVNGEIGEDEVDKIAESGLAENEIKLGENEYFVLGDNRNNSEDSRSAKIRNVKSNTIIRKAWLHLGTEDDGIGFVK